MCRCTFWEDTVHHHWTVDTTLEEIHPNRRAPAADPSYIVTVFWLAWKTAVLTHDVSPGTNGHPKVFDSKRNDLQWRSFLIQMGQKRYFCRSPLFQDTWRIFILTVLRKKQTILGLRIVNEFYAFCLEMVNVY